MNVILQLTAIQTDDADQLAYMVKITQGADQVNTEEDLLDELKGTQPAKKGIISVQRLSTSMWAIGTHKK
jgi:hypothetical protein